MALFNRKEIVKTIVVRMYITDHSSIVSAGRQVELQVTDIGLNKLPKGIMKGDDTSDGELERIVYDAVKPEFEKMTGVEMGKEEHREFNKK
mgnify:FL=1|tara:strand:+ start:274 stop:546 length:273 start_codon:yes stop_codon:yes gene_type:complete